jgi:hypothetical protein
MINKVYLDSITTPPKYIRSVLTVLYNMLILQRSPRVREYHMGFEKLLEIPYVEIGDEDIASMVRQQIDKVALSIDPSKEQTILVTFKVYAEDKKRQNRFISLLKSSVDQVNLEEFDFPIGVSHQPPNLSLLISQVRERANKILQHVQKDTSSMHGSYDLKFDLVLRKSFA